MGKKSPKTTEVECVSSKTGTQNSESNFLGEPHINRKPLIALLQIPLSFRSETGALDQGLSPGWQLCGTHPSPPQSSYSLTFSLYQEAWLWQCCPWSSQCQSPCPYPHLEEGRSRYDISNLGSCSLPWI